jgi:phosphatidylinositol 3,5-bisphosphate 5-phosphatase
MEGMKRWISANPTASITNGKGLPRGQSKMDNPDSEVDPHSTETMALQLLDPSVSKEEEAEYQGYVISYTFSVTLENHFFQLC